MSSPALSASGLSIGGADRRAAEKEVQGIARKIQKIEQSMKKVDAELAAHDQGDYEGLGVITAKRQALAADVDALEERWLELSEVLEA